MEWKWKHNLYCQTPVAVTLDHLNGGKFLFGLACICTKVVTL